MSYFPSLFHSEFDSINENLEKEKCVKSQEMIEKLQKAAHLADAGYQAAVRLVKPGAYTEEIYQEMQAEFAASIPNDLCKIKMISGPIIQAHLPARDTRRVLDDRDLLFLEITGKYQDVFFCSSRVFVAGKPDAAQEKFIRHLGDAFEWMSQTIKPGKEAAFYHAESRGRAIAPYAHGIGNHLFEPPFIEPHKNYLVQPGTFLCLAPFLQSQEFGTAYIREMVLVTPEGCKRINEFPLVNL